MPVHEGPFAPGTPCWADVMVDDLDRARDFYGGLFGWTFEDLPPEAGGYVMARKDGHVVAGALAKNPDDPGQVSAWTVYLATDDVDDTVRTRQGGRRRLLPRAHERAPGGAHRRRRRPRGRGLRAVAGQGAQPAPTSSTSPVRCAGPSR